MTIAHNVLDRKSGHDTRLCHSDSLESARILATARCKYRKHPHERLIICVWHPNGELNKAPYKRARLLARLCSYAFAATSRALCLYLSTVSSNRSQDSTRSSCQDISHTSKNSRRQSYRSTQASKESPIEFERASCSQQSLKNTATPVTEGPKRGLGLIVNFGAIGKVHGMAAGMMDAYLDIYIDQLQRLRVNRILMDPRATAGALCLHQHLGQCMLKLTQNLPSSSYHYSGCSQCLQDQ